MSTAAHKRERALRRFNFRMNGHRWRDDEPSPKQIEHYWFNVACFRTRQAIENRLIYPSREDYKRMARDFMRETVSLRRMNTAIQSFAQAAE